MATARAASLLSAARQLLEYEDPKAAAEARRKAEEALKAFGAGGDAAGALEALRQIVTADLARAQPQEALRMAKDKLWEFQSNNDRRGEATMLLALAEVYASMQETRGAVDAAKKAVSLCQRLGDSKLELLVQKLLVGVYLDVDSKKEALTAANQAVGLAKRVPDEGLKADAAFELMRARLNAEARDAFAAANEALALYTRAGDKRGEAATLQALARAQLQKREASGAVKSAKAALDLFEEVDNVKGMVAALEILVSAYIQCQEPQQALDVATEKHQRLMQKGDKVGQAAVSVPLFLALRSQEDQQVHANEALEVANDALRIFRELGDRKGEADMWVRVSETHLNWGMADSAKQEAQEARMMYRELRDKKGEDNANIVLTEAYIRQGEPALAPLHPEGVELLAKIAAAVEERDSAAFRKASERLGAIGGYGLVTETEQMAILGPAMRKDPEGASEFIASNSPDAGELEEGGEQNKPVGMRCPMEKNTFYASFRWGGIQYGPRYRCTEFAVRLNTPMVGEEHEALGYSTINIQDCSDDWEVGLKYHPGILDCALQSGSCLGELAAPQPKAKEKGK